jgi:hypothetical protein
MSAAEDTNASSQLDKEEGAASLQPLEFLSAESRHR